MVRAVSYALRAGAVPAVESCPTPALWSTNPQHRRSTVLSRIPSTTPWTISCKKFTKQAHLKAGCGIGYEFLPCAPKVRTSGAGAYTGLLSFMDIYDKMFHSVFPGGRRGAQMGTFDIGHPDVMDFIRAKREDGRSRQFNQSLDYNEFMEAVRRDTDWVLVFRGRSRKSIPMASI